jgi:hypothetical protein
VEAGGGFKVKLVKALFHRGYDFVTYQEDMEDVGLETKIVANKNHTGYELMVFRRWWTFKPGAVRQPQFNKGVKP